MKNQIQSAAVRKEVEAAQRQQNVTEVKGTMRNWEVLVLASTIIVLGVIVGFYCVTYGVFNAY